MRNQELWDSYMQAYDFLTEVESYNQNIRTFADVVNVEPGLKVLDAGSGTGNLSLLLKRGGAEVTSCDFSPAALARHRRKDPHAQQVLASLEDPLPFADREFDAICCASVLFTLSREGCRSALREFSRIMKRTGRLVVSVPSAEARLVRLVEMLVRDSLRRLGPWRGGLRVLGNLRPLAKVLHYNWKLRELPDWEGFHIFSEQELESALRQEGFHSVALTRTYGGRFLLAIAQKEDLRAATQTAEMKRHLNSVSLVQGV